MREMCQRMPGSRWKELAWGQEEGQVLAIALITMIFGALVIVPFLLLTSAALQSSGRTGENIQAYYAADAGVEDAIWQVRYGTVPTTTLTFPGSSTTYTLPQPLNGFTVTVTITRTKTNIALEDFESGGSTGGIGWLAGWTLSGDAGVVGGGDPYQGDYHLRLRRDTGYAERGVDLSGLSNLRLQFWAKVDSFETGETAVLKVGPVGNLTTVKTWTNADSDNTYHFYDIDLTPYTMASDFRIVFEANMAQKSDRFYVDDIQIIRALPGVLPGLPMEDFETGGWSGGYGWLDSWSHSGDSSIQSSGSPHGGTYHLRLRKGNGTARRRANLLGLSNLRVQFWSKAESFEGGENAAFLVRSDGGSWTTVKTWTAAEADGTYHFNDLDLSPYTMASNFRLRFDANMGDTNDFFYVDDLRIVGPTAYEILSTADTFPIRALVLIRGTQVVILSWKAG
jgi:hypothetical protein